MLAKPSIITVDDCVDTSRAFEAALFRSPDSRCNLTRWRPPRRRIRYCKVPLTYCLACIISASAFPRSLYWVFVRDMEQWRALATELSTAAGHGRSDCPSDGARTGTSILCSALLLDCWAAAVGRGCFLFFLDAPDELLPLWNETIALVAGPLSLFGPRRPSPQAGSRTPPGTAHVCFV